MAEAADRGEHPGHRSRRLGAAWLLLCAIVFTTAAISLWLVDAGRGNLAPPYSVQRTDEEGGALLYQLYQRAGIRTRVWDREFTDLREPGLLLLLDPPPGPSLGSSSTGDILPYELDALDRWVQQGNVVALFSGRQNLLYTHLGLWLPREGGERHDSAQAAHQGVLTRNVKSLDLTLAAGFRFEPEAPASRFGLEPGEPTSAPKPLIPRNHWVGLFRFPGASSGSPTAPGKGWPVVAAARGRGLYLAVAEVVPAGNLGLSQADNARFLLNLASLGPARGTIWLDEYHRRNVTRGLVSYLAGRGLLPVLLYTLVLLGLGCWRAGVPFGRRQPGVEGRVRDTREYVQALGTLYHAGNAGSEALRVLLRQFRRSLMGPEGSPAEFSPTAAAQRWAERTGGEVRHAGQILEEIARLLADRPRDEATGRPLEKAPEAALVAAAQGLAELEAALPRNRRRSLSTRDPGRT